MLSFDDIDQSAAATLALAEATCEDMPAPLERIAAHLGFEVLPFLDRDDLAGAIDHAGKRIFIDSSAPWVRQRFWLAHQIGHAVLHPGEDREDLQRKIADTADPKEHEANRFASSLLMPAEVFKRKWEEYHRAKSGRGGKSHTRLAEYFDVSTAAAVHREKSLRLEWYDWM